MSGLVNMMVYVDEAATTGSDTVRRMLDLQVDNSLELGWPADRILLMTSFAYEHAGIAAVQVEVEQRPRTARKTSFHKTCCMLSALDGLAAGDSLWYHDVDAFQLAPFDRSPAIRPLAFCMYSTRERLLVQGGSMFVTAAARPVFAYVDHRLRHTGCRKDEFALTDAMAVPELEGSFELLDYSWNLGDTNFELRYQLAARPIRVAHFHPERPEHRATFLEGANGLRVTPLDERFLGLLDRHGFGPSTPPRPESISAPRRWRRALRRALRRPG